jgi:hypothetical protein
MRDDLVLDFDARVTSSIVQLAGSLDFAISPRALKRRRFANRHCSTAISLILGPLAAVYHYLPVDVLVYAVAAADALDPLAIVARPIRILYLALAVRAAEIVTLARIAILKAILTFLSRTLIHLLGLSDCVRNRLTRHYLRLRVHGLA